MVREIDAAHAAGAEVAEQLVFAKKKSLVATFKKFFALPLRDQFFFNNSPQFSDRPAIVRPSVA
jgi:hypothetical protein